MSEDGIMVASAKAQIADRNKHKIVYLVTAEALDKKTENDFFHALKLDRNQYCLGIKGFSISKKEAVELSESGKNSLVENQEELDIEIPWLRIKRIENITYKLAKKEKQNE